MLERVVRWVLRIASALLLYICAAVVIAHQPGQPAYFAMAGFIALVVSFDFAVVLFGLSFALPGVSRRVGDAARAPAAMCEGRWSTMCAGVQQMVSVYCPAKDKLLCGQCQAIDGCSLGTHLSPNKVHLHRGAIPKLDRR
jgi:hypothetical protein